MLHKYSENNKTKHYFLSETFAILGVLGTLGARSGKEDPKGAFPGEKSKLFWRYFWDNVRLCFGVIILIFV